MAEPLSAIRNIGPALEAAFQRAGIKDAETLRDLGADAGYLELLKSGVRPHFIGYYVIVMGLQGRPWNDCQGQEKRISGQGLMLLKHRQVLCAARRKTRLKNYLIKLV